jgi:hypothetical protein
MAAKALFVGLVSAALAAGAIVADDGSAQGRASVVGADPALPAASQAACGDYPDGWSLVSAAAAGRLELEGPNGEQITIEPESAYDGVALVSAGAAGVTLGAPFLHASGATVRQSAAGAVTVATFPAIDGFSGFVYSMADSDAGCLAGNLDSILHGFAGYPPLGAQPW